MICRHNYRILAGALVMVGVAWLLSCGTEQAEKGGANAKVNLASESPGSDSLTITLVGEDSVSVFDLLKRSHDVDSWSTAVGVFVNGIDSFNNGPRVFWIYSVNDSMPDIASDKRVTRAGDRVVWHFRRVQ